MTEFNGTRHNHYNLAKCIKSIKGELDIMGHVIAEFLKTRKGKKLLKKMGGGY